jgi:tRNA/tmRNA/rRNA uracil-C5-methylase (TrmA/RlmC/RlmD family)
LQLMAHAYNIERSCAADLFPHTHHVENITLLTLKEGR